MSRVVLALLALILLSCSGPQVAGGTSSSENARIVGIAMTSDGNAAAGAMVYVRSDSSLPGDLNTRYSASCNSEGRYEVLVPKGGTYTFFIEDTSGVMSIRSGVKGERELLDTLEPAGTLLITDESGVLSVGTEVDIAGTDLTLTVEAIDEFGRALVSDVPPGSVAGIALDMKTVMGQLQIESESVTEVFVGDVVVKPIWRFPLLIGVRQEVADHFGGLNAVEDSLKVHYTSVVERFYHIDEIDGHIVFDIDSVYLFDSYFNERNSAPEGYLVRVLYTDETVSSSSARAVLETDYIWFSSPSFSFFQDWDERLAAKLLAETRGALDLEEIVVNATTSPIETEGFTPEHTLMYLEDQAKTFDPYTLHVINGNRDNIGNELALLNRAIPNEVVLHIQNSSGDAVSDADVTLYKSQLRTKTLEQSPIASGKSGSNGLFQFDGSLYQLNDKLEYGTILCQIETSQSDTLIWIPVNEVGEAWFADSLEYLKSVILKE